MIYADLYRYKSPNVSVTVGNYFMQRLYTFLSVKKCSFKLPYTRTFGCDLLCVFLADERWDK